MIIKILILVALIRLMLATGKPFLCSGLYAGVVFFFSLITGAKFGTLLITTPVVFAFASLYFWLLHRFENNMFLFWAVAAVGIVIGFV